MKICFKINILIKASIYWVLYSYTTYKFILKLKTNAIFLCIVAVAMDISYQLSSFSETKSIPFQKL